VIGVTATQTQSLCAAAVQKATTMEFTKQIQHAALAALAAAFALVGSRVHAQTADDPAVDGERGGVRLQLDNDLFAGGERDRDYTGGFALTISGEEARNGLLSLDPLLATIDRLLPATADARIYHARQIGLMAFTPADTITSEVQPDDRPYASLLFVSNGRMRVDADDRGAWYSSLTIGFLGLSIAEDLHNTVHKLVGSEEPHGYDYQISKGGEPTAKYTVARQNLWIANPSGNFDVKTTVQGSVGYLTEASAAISMRIGRFDTPWWSFAPELSDYIAAPVPLQSRGSQPELYFFAGARVTARAYNAFLQGQFRDSAVTYSYGETEPVVASAWIGVVTHIFEQTQLSYTLNYQTAELSEGKGARDALWGGVQLAHSF
jgi:hypothetical protein